MGDGAIVFGKNFNRVPLFASISMCLYTELRYQLMTRERHVYRLIQTHWHNGIRPTNNVFDCFALVYVDYTTFLDRLYLNNIYLSFLITYHNESDKFN